MTPAPPAPPASRGTGVAGSGGSNGIGVAGYTNSTSRFGAIYAHNTSWQGSPRALYALISSNNNYGGYAVYAENQSAGNYGYGVYGVTRSRYGYGVRGYTSHASGTAVGATGGMTGVYATGASYGVYGRATKTTGYGVYSVGNMRASGHFSAVSKSFLHPHPTDAAKMVQFVCLEGNEAGTYFRGTTKLINGRAEIPIPKDWQLVSADHGVTVQLTAVRSFARLMTESRSRTRIVVRGTEDCSFDYTVNGVRRGFEGVETLIANDEFRPQLRGVPFGMHYPQSIRDMLVENHILNANYTPNEATATRLGWELREPVADPTGGRKR